MDQGAFQQDVIRALKDQFRFKSERGAWLQQGQCPDCGKWEVYCASTEPKVVKCSRIDRCGWQESVRDLLPDLFEDWSKRFEPTDTAPNATADAYLRHARGLDLTGLRDAFTQEWYQDKERNIGSATVRFPLPGGSWWERIIDRPGRFDKKARFKFGATYAGHWWQHPQDSTIELATLDELWIAEGIFDALALRQSFPAPDAATGIARRSAVSVMSISNYPEKALADLADVCTKKGLKSRPLLVFAYDVGKGGVTAAKKHVARARAEGWPASAAQVRPDGEGTKLDWNDLALRHQQWDGPPEKRPLGEEMLKFYRWCGDVTIAESPREKARLIYDKTGLFKFDMRHDNRIFWVEVKHDEDGNTKIDPEEIANCAFKILYRERDEAADETNYFIQVEFPNNTPVAKARFSAACCAASGEFKKRLFAFSGMWAGSQYQLDRLMRAQTRQVKTVEPLHFTGYSAPHKAWVLGDLAVRDGRVIQINKENYLELGKQAVKLGTTERLLEIQWDPDKLDLSWAQDLWTAYGPRGLVTLGFFTMALFAQQIRARHKSLGFLEVTGPPGSGKSTLVEFCWRLLGRSGYEGFDPNKGSIAGIARNFQKVANLPVGLIEGNRDSGKTNARQFDWAELLTLYNGRSPRSVGRKSGGTETFEPPFLGAIYLMQNERIDAIDAVLERLMSFQIDKAEWSEATKAAALRIESWPIETASAFIIHVIRHEAAWLEYFFARYQHHDRDMPRRKEGLHNSRAIKCHSQLAAGVEALAKLLPLRPEWIAETIKLVDWMALDRQQSSGADHPLVQRFWEQVDYLESIEDHDNGNQPVRPINLHRKPDEFWAVNLPHYEERCRSRGMQSVPTDLLHKLLPGSKARKCIGKKPVNCADGKHRHCWVFQRPAGTAGKPASQDDVL